MAPSLQKSQKRVCDICEKEKECKIVYGEKADIGREWKCEECTDKDYWNNVLTDGHINHN